MVGKFNICLTIESMKPTIKLNLMIGTPDVGAFPVTATTNGNPSDRQDHGLQGKARLKNRSRPRPPDAENSSGSSAAACFVRRDGPADCMLARATTESTSDAGCTTAGVSPTAKTSIGFLPLWWSPYTTCQTAPGATCSLLGLHLSYLVDSPRAVIGRPLTHLLPIFKVPRAHLCSVLTEPLPIPRQGTINSLAACPDSASLVIFDMLFGRTHEWWTR